MAFLRSFLARFPLRAFARAAVLLLAAVPSTAAKPAATLLETARAAGGFKTLLAALAQAGLDDALDGHGPFTVFAPTDEAFAALPAGTLDSLLKPENRAQLQAILKYHVLALRVSAAEASNLRSARTLNGQQLPLALAGGALTAGRARVIAADLACRNGVIHVIDRVLLPSAQDLVETAAANGEFKILVKALGVAGLADALHGPGPFTVFAPTDAAFAKLPRGTVAALLKPENRAQLVALLKYHVATGRVFARDLLARKSLVTLGGESVGLGAGGGGLTVNHARIQAADLDTVNGVIHAIDTVLMPGENDRPMPAVARADPRGLIEFAIERGAPLYNRGEPGACASIYEVTGRSLLQLPEGAFGAGARAALDEAVRRAREPGDDAGRAWALRRALDSALASLP